VLLVDTNVWLASMDRRSTRHKDCVELLSAHRRQIASPVPVIAESSWLILDRLGVAAQDRFLSLVPSGELVPLDLIADDWIRCVSLCREYADLRLDFIDASLIAIAERLGELKIATFNYRDFLVVRPLHTEAFQLVP
jgi:uncharacterized protein